MRVAGLFGLLLTGAAGSHAAAQAHFSIIGTAPGYAQIGALSGSTLYGTLPNGAGVLFSMSTTGSYTPLHNFTAGTDGSGPNAQLAIDKAGDLYGTTRSGGAYGGGTLWEYTASGSFLTLHSFGGGSDGAVPMQGPTLGKHGTVYGTTGEGAIGGSGNIFSYGQNSGYDVLYEFMSGADGHCPFSGVAVAKNGTLYGTTVGVGTGGNPNGSVFKYSAAGGLQTMYVFADGADGEWPTQTPTTDGSGDVFGTTSTQKGASFAGAVWKIDSVSGFSLLHNLNGSTDGYAPNSPLLFDRHTLYGTTASGGSENEGTVFSVTKDGSFAVVHSFTNTGDGEQPTGNLVKDSADTLYGGTATGQVFKLTP
jgi:uncharacterized repeat protein (TIGR03803 family)